MRTVAGGTIYRWEADGGSSGNGHVLFDLGNLSVRPCAEDGRPIDDLTVRGADSQLSGSSTSVDKLKFVRVANALLSEFNRSGSLPETAHKYYG